MVDAKFLAHNNCLQYTHDAQKRIWVLLCLPLVKVDWNCENGWKRPLWPLGVKDHLIQTSGAHDHEKFFIALETLWEEIK